MRKDKKSPSVTENWVKTETLDEYKNAAKKTLARAKQLESERSGVLVKVSDTPKTYKRVIK
ncbi:MAG TPA: hypothetical protein VN182_06710 [Flavobacterium sp.]|nr:hypothetical protein [Flavobacterium sp.]